jgi:adenosylmethionine-8-amino-7-oxononanoate aminotransferase
MGSQILEDAQKFLFLHNTMRKDMQEGRVPVIVRGEGNYIFDEEGKRYLDLVAGNTRPNGIGYGREEVAKAMYEQAKTLHYYTPAFFVTPTSVELAKKLASLYPGDLRVTCLVCDGSEAVESAFKIAKQYHYFANKQRRFKIISRQMAYHGQTMGALSALGYLNQMRNIVAPLVPGHSFLIPPYCYRCPLNLTYPACDLPRDAQLPDPAGGARFSGLSLVAGHRRLGPEGYFEKIRKFVTAVLLIIDEVICGLATGKMPVSALSGETRHYDHAKMLTGDMRLQRRPPR